MVSYRKSMLDRVQQGDRLFRWRGESVSRLESLFDMVIALALTLIVVSNTAPRTYQDLMGSVTVARFAAFAVSFAILLMCWYYHYLFHRRYGIEDYPMVILNCVLMFLVVFYVYPLRFLYEMLFSGRGIEAEEIRVLMYLYSGGFSAIFFVLLLMQIYAWMRREALELDMNERIMTKMKMGEHVNYVCIGLLSIALTFNTRLLPWAGMIYVLIGPAQFFNALWWSRYLKEPS